MMVKLLLLFLWVTSLSSCASRNLLEGSGIPNVIIKDASVLSLQSEELRNILPAKRKPVIAIYANSLQDLTGQRKSNGSFAMFSTAITQAPEAFLIRALKYTASGEFFKVTERVGLDSLTKERQLIRSTRDNFDEESKLKPLLLAGLLMQGGVIGYDSNTFSGGAGARMLGIGSSKQYRSDSVSVSLRLVSVSTGEVLLEVLTSKSILSVSLSQDVFRFVDINGASLIEMEGGITANESTSIALQKAIEAGVLEMVKIGIRKGYWEYE